MPQSWKVVATIPQTGFDVSGKAGAGTLVTYQIIPQGSTGQVFIPAASVTPAGVKAIIQPLADNLGAIASLSSDT